MTGYCFGYAIMNKKILHKKYYCFHNNVLFIIFYYNLIRFTSYVIYLAFEFYIIHSSEVCILAIG